MILPPPKLEDLKYGETLVTGMGVSTVIADFDFETYSPAGYVFNRITNKFEGGGLPEIGTINYAKEAEVLCLAYNLKDGLGTRVWTPAAKSFPQDLFDHLNKGLLLEAWNVSFEKSIWNYACVSKYGFPLLPINQLRCAKAKSSAFALPPSLEKAGIVLKTTNQKDAIGKRLIHKFCIPRNPTLKNASKRIFINEDPEGPLLLQYCKQDIATEADISSRVPDLDDFELAFWQVDQEINQRGVQIDKKSVLAAISICEQAYAKYNKEIEKLTDGQVKAASEIQKIITWLNSKGVNTSTLDAKQVECLLNQHDVPYECRRVLELRQLLGSASVKKLYAMQKLMTDDGRVHNLFIYHSARTGRAAGGGIQPQNLPKGTREIDQCKSCKKHYYVRPLNPLTCFWCGYDLSKSVEWNIDAVNDALEIINTKSLTCTELCFGDALETISGCLRGLIISASKHDLICSDYSAIEAVVLAELAGEQWRIDVFKTHGKIYEMSASKITGMSFEDYEKYKKETGQHHPSRNKIGKIAELASGYQGWIGAWKQFGADKLFNDEEIKNAVLAWRAASPKIVEMWGGQYRRSRKEFFGLEGAAIQAVLFPNNEFEYRGIKYIVKNDILFCKLLSGRYLTYHKPRLDPSTPPRQGLSLSFEGYNTNPKQGPVGWIRMKTYGGKLTENVVQATARDLLAYAILELEKNGYPVVLHVHDEIVSEVKENVGSVEEFETLMNRKPTWAQGWPVFAKGGWRGKRYHKSS